MQALILVVCTLALFTASTAGNVCNSGIYALLEPLSSYPIAQQWCTQNFPPVTVTISVAVNARPKRVAAASTTAATTSKIAATTITSKVVAPLASSSPTTTSSAAAVSVQQNNKAKPSSTATTSADSMTSLFKQCTNAPWDIASSFCSCVEHHPTVYKSTTTTTSSKTTTVSFANLF